MEQSAALYSKCQKSKDDEGYGWGMAQGQGSGGIKKNKGKSGADGIMAAIGDFFHFKKHKKFWFGVLIFCAAIAVFSAVGHSMAKKEHEAYVTGLPNEARETENVKDTFYYSQLTDREQAAYKLLEDDIASMKGGVVTFPEKLNGTEYTRVVAALNDEDLSAFYAIVDVPMTENNVYVKKTDSDLLKITDSTIAKAILFLYPAEGIDEQGSYADDGTVQNIDQISSDLSAVNADRLKTLQDLQAKTEEALSKAVSGLPEGAGEKDALLYFLTWMKENLKAPENLAKDANDLTTMHELFEKVYFRENISCAADGEADTNGYAKVLCELLHRAGMEAHIVFGSWGYTETTGYVLVAAKLGDETVYIDASGANSDSLGGAQILSKAEAANHMKFNTYFQYE